MWGGGGEGGREGGREGGSEREGMKAKLVRVCLGG